MAHGNFQINTIEYAELYTLVTCIKLLGAMLSVAVPKDCLVNYMGIKGASLYATLPEAHHIWVQLLMAEEMKSDNNIVQLLKSLYNLRQALKLRFDHFTGMDYPFELECSTDMDSLLNFVTPNLANTIFYVDLELVIRSNTAVTYHKTLFIFSIVTNFSFCFNFLGHKMDSTEKMIMISMRKRGIYFPHHPNLFLTAS